VRDERTCLPEVEEAQMIEVAIRDELRQIRILLERILCSMVRLANPLD
jgi:hypothetical protein